jgi:hypothetical protein
MPATCQHRQPVRRQRPALLSRMGNGWSRASPRSGPVLIGVLMVIICADIVGAEPVGGIASAGFRARRSAAGDDCQLQLATTIRADRLARTDLILCRIEDVTAEDRGTAVGLLQSGRRHHHRPDCLGVDPHSRKGLVVGRLHRNYRHRDLADMAVSRSDPAGMTIAAIEFMVRRSPTSVWLRHKGGKAMSPIEIGALA